MDYFCRLLRTSVREDSGDSREDCLGEAKTSDVACWFHTHFVENGRLRLTKCELDKACKDKKVSSDLRVSIKFHRVTGPRTWRPPPRSKRAPSPNNVVP